MKKSRGFTLIELMITVAIVAILAAIAYPSYQEYVRKTRRAQAKADMMELTQRLERTYTMDRAYTAATTICGQTVNSPATGTTFYQIATECEAGTFTVTATPQGAQSSDKCGTLSIDQLGAKNSADPPGPANCW